MTGRFLNWNGGVRRLSFFGAFPKENILIRLLAASLAFLPCLQNCEAAIYHKGEPVLKGGKFVVDFEKLYWCPSPESPDQDRIQGHMELLVNEDVQSIVVVVQLLDTKGLVLSSFSITPQTCPIHPSHFYSSKYSGGSYGSINRYPFCGVENPRVEVDSYDRNSEAYKTGEKAWYYVDFHRIVTAQSLRVVNVVVNGREVQYNVRFAANKLLRSPMQAPAIKHGRMAAFGSEASCLRWIPPDVKDENPGKKTNDELPISNSPKKEERIPSAIPPAKKVVVSPGQKASLAKVENGDILVLQYVEGVCGRTAQRMLSPDEKEASARPQLFLEQTDPAFGVIRREQTLDTGTRNLPQAIVADFSGEFFLELRSSYMGNVIYRVWKIPKENSDAFYDSPLGRMVKSRHK